jgi:hypothetical protein
MSRFYAYSGQKVPDYLSEKTGVRAPRYHTKTADTPTAKPLSR